MRPLGDFAGPFSTTEVIHKFEKVNTNVLGLLVVFPILNIIESSKKFTLPHFKLPAYTTEWCDRFYEVNNVVDQDISGNPNGVNAPHHF